MAQDPEQLEALLAEYVEGDLDAEGTRAVEAHLAANPAGRALIERMRGDRAAIRAMPKLTAPAELSEDLRGQLERNQLLNDEPMTMSRTRRFSPPMAAMAAMLMVGLGLAGVAYMLLANRPTPYVVIASGTPTTNGAGPSDETSSRREDAARSREATVERTDAVDDRIGAGGTLADAAATTPRPEAAARMSRDAMNAPATGDESATTAVPERGLDVARGLVAGGAIADPPAADAANPAVMSAAPTAPPTFEVADAAPPADVVAALEGRYFDDARRSVVIVVEQPEALDALATVSRSARLSGTPVEVSERAAQIALPGNAAIDQQQQSNSMFKAALKNEDVGGAEVAVVARGLSTNAAAAIQSELRQLEPKRAELAYDVPATLIENTALATTTPALAATVSESAATRPTTRAFSGVIAAGEKLRVTLVDPDAFDLRTQHEVTVDRQGNIELPSLEGVTAAGASVDTLRTTIADAYKEAKLMRRPIVRVESIDSGASSKDAVDQAKLIDVYLVIRKPAATPPTTEPASQPATQPTQPTE